MLLKNKGVKVGSYTSIVFLISLVLWNCAGTIPSPNSIQDAIERYEVGLLLYENGRYDDAARVWGGIKADKLSKQESLSLLTALATAYYKSGNLKAFLESESEIEAMLSEREKVEAPGMVSELIALARYLRGEPLPINAPSGLLRWKNEHKLIQKKEGK